MSVIMLQPKYPLTYYSLVTSDQWHNQGLACMAKYHLFVLSGMAINILLHTLKAGNLAVYPDFPSQSKVYSNSMSKELFYVFCLAIVLLVFLGHYFY